MIFGLILTFGIGMSLSMGAAVTYYGRAAGARASALMLSRVTTIGDDDDSLTAQRLPGKRLAHNMALRRLLVGAPTVSGVAELLDQAGSPKTVAQFFGYTVGGGLGAGALCVLFGLRVPAAVFIGFFTSMFPYFYYMHLRAQRITAFEAQLPQALELLTLYLRSGRSLPQAFVAATEELSPPASEEFSVCAEAYRLGRPLPEALRTLSNKYQDSLGLKLFSIAVSVLGQTGGNLVEVIDRIRKTMEASLMYVLKLRGLTGETRTSAIILGAVPGFFMAATALIMPDYFNQFFESVTGYIVFAVFCFVWIAGLVWVRVLMSSKA